MTILTKIVEDLQTVQEEILVNSTYYGAACPMTDLDDVIQRLLNFDKLLTRSFGNSSDLEFNLEE